MFDIGFWELCLIAVMGLLVLGPERLPVAVKTITGWIRKIKTISRNMTQEIEKELDLSDFRKELDEKNETIKQQAKLLSDQLGQPVESLTSLKSELEDSIASLDKNRLVDTSMVSKPDPSEALDSPAISNNSVVSDRHQTLVDLDSAGESKS